MTDCYPELLTVPAIRPDLTATDTHLDDKHANIITSRPQPTKTAAGQRL